MTNPKRTLYPWTLARDASSGTFFTRGMRPSGRTGRRGGTTAATTAGPRSLRTERGWQDSVEPSKMRLLSAVSGRG